MVKRKELTRTKGVKQTIKREGKALFVGISTFAGAAAFLIILRESWGVPTNWMWLAITTALIILPKVFTKLQGSKEPYIIQFARAFREGFLSLSSVVPNLSKWIAKLREPLKTLLEKGDSPAASGEIAP
jgi:hypothetical protein